MAAATGSAAGRDSRPSTATAAAGRGSNGSTVPRSDLMPYLPLPRASPHRRSPSSGSDQLQRRNKRHGLNPRGCGSSLALEDTPHRAQFRLVACLQLSSQALWAFNSLLFPPLNVPSPSPLCGGADIAIIDNQWPEQRFTPQARRRHRHRHLAVLPALCSQRPSGTRTIVVSHCQKASFD